MVYEIDKEILNRTTKCEHKLVCLTDGNCPNCDVECRIGGNCVFVKLKEGRSCFYVIPHDGRYICSCPTRCALYEKYEV